MKEKIIIEKEKKDIPKIYLGPTISKYGLTSGTTFIELSDNIKEVINEYPEISALFLSIDEKFAENKENIKKEGSRENILFKKILKKLGGK